MRKILWITVSLLALALFACYAVEMNWEARDRRTSERRGCYREGYDDAKAGRPPVQRNLCSDTDLTPADRAACSAQWKEDNK